MSANTEIAAVVPPEASPAPAIEESKSKVEATEPPVIPVVAAPAAPTSPLSKLLAELPSIIKDAEYKEMWGIELADESHVPTTIVLEKFLRANAKDVTKAKAQLTEALKWRKKIQPQNLLAEVEFDAAKFGGLGYVTTYPKSDSHAKEIITWNIYGAVKNNKATFGNVEE